MDKAITVTRQSLLSMAGGSPGILMTVPGQNPHIPYILATRKVVLVLPRLCELQPGFLYVPVDCIVFGRCFLEYFWELIPLMSVIAEGPRYKAGQSACRRRSGRESGLWKGSREVGSVAQCSQNQIEAVEGVLGVRLFEGKKGNRTLTEDGQIFLPDAGRSVEHALLAEEKVLMRLALRSHQLPIGHSTYLAPQLIALIHRIGVEGDPPVQLHHVSGLT